MRRATAVLVAVLVVGATGAAGLGGYGPLAGVVEDLPDAGAGPDDGSGGGGAGDGSGGGTSGSGDGGGSSGDGSGAGGDGGGTATASGDGGPPFAIAIASIEECGRTCRDVTLEVTNERNATATGVSVVARIFAGKRDEDGDKVWQGSADLGTLAPGETVSVTRRVNLGLVDAGKVKRADGWVTVRTTVTGDDASRTVVSEEDVI